MGEGENTRLNGNRVKDNSVIVVTGKRLNSGALSSPLFKMSRDTRMIIGQSEQPSLRQERKKEEKKMT